MTSSPAHLSNQTPPPCNTYAFLSRTLHIVSDPVCGGQDSDPVCGGGQDSDPVCGGGQDSDPVQAGGQDSDPVCAGGQDSDPVYASEQDSDPTKVPSLTQKKLLSCTWICFDTT